MPASARRFVWPLVVVALACSIYLARIHVEMVDFEVYRTAATRALAAEPLYRTEDGHYQFKYLPAYAFAMFPFAFGEDRYARLVWYALSIGLLCAFVRWSVHGVPERRLSTTALTWCAVLLVGKYYARELNLGQSNLLLGACLISALLAVQSGSMRRAGAWVAVGVFVKPYAVILLPWLWLTAGVAGVSSGAVVIAAGLLLPALTFGWAGNLDQLTDWFRTVTDTSAPNLLVPENVSFQTMWAKWIGVGPAASALGWATSAVALAIAGVIMARRRGVREPAYLEFGALMLLVPLISPQGWDYVLLLATPAILILADRWRDTPLAWRAITGVAIAGFSFTIFDLLGRRLYTLLTSINIVSLSALVLLMCLLHHRWRKLA
jgi:hypothetical protein